MIKIKEQSTETNPQDIKDNVNDFFGTNTPLIKAKELGGGRKYEERPQQQAMATAIAESFTSLENLCIEAPTGVGKSFAYLIPAIYYSIEQSKPVIISTETINLQEQLIDKDIPLLRELLDFEFKSVLAKGRANYLCKRRLQMATGEHQSEYLPSNSCVPEISLIACWRLQPKLVLYPIWTLNQVLLYGKIYAVNMETVSALNVNYTINVFTGTPEKNGKRQIL